MRNFTFLLLFLLLGGLFGKASAQGGAGVVSGFGRLQVANAHVCSEAGVPVSLGGMSMFWSGWASKYYTAATVDYLVDNFKISVLRATYGCPAGSGPQGDVNDIQAVVNQCIARGIYVIIDWHIEGDDTPYEAQEISFFQSMVQQYGNYNNVLYELWNEPTTSSASTIQGVCQRVANAIRAKETQLGYSHKLVICGSNTWSQYPNSYSINDPNAAYTFHGYFDNQPSHLSQLTSNAAAAMNQGNAVFVTEYGASYCNHSNTDQAIAWCQANNISMCAWSVNDKPEDWSIFTNNMDALTCIGSYYKGKISSWPTPTPIKVYPTAVAVNSTSVTIPVLGSTAQLSPVFTPANTTEKVATWTSSNPAVATVSATGLVTGVSAGTATITVTSKTQAGANITGTCAVTVQNLTNVALNKTVTVSSTESSTYPGSYAVDGSATTRWSSAASDPTWIQVDLGASYNVSNISLNWEAAAAKDYTVQISADGTSWTTISTQTGMAAGPRVDNLSVSGIGRYIKVNGTARTTTYGYSLFELAVYGTPGVVVHPTSVSVSPAPSTVTVGGTTQLTATVLPSNTTNPSVTWSSSNPAIATVNASGLVTSVAAGTAVITATTVDLSLTSTSSLTVTTVPVSSVSLPASASVSKGATTTLTATILPANASNKNVSWSSSNTAVATVSAAGVVTGVALGTANITVTTADGAKTAVCAVTVTNAWSVQIEAESYSYKTSAPTAEACSDLGAGQDMGYIGNGDYMIYNVNVPTAGTYTISYRVASINTTGQIILGINGTDLTAPLSVPNTGGWQTWNTITTTANLPAGTTAYTVYAKTGGFNINWWSVSSSSVTTYPVTGVSVSPATVSLSVGSTSSLTATVAPSNATNKNVTWSSSNPAVATVNASGIVTGVATGTAVITATTVDGAFTSSSTVTVSGPVFTPIHIEAETFNASGAGTAGNIQIEACSDVNGGQDVGYISAGCWFSYPVITIPQTATYTISYRVASPNSGLTFNLSSGSTTLDANVPVPNTGGWQNWQTVSRQVSLTAGTYNMAFGYFTGAVNINWFEISNPLKSGAVSNEKVASEASVRFYPNPAESELHVESSLSDINEIAVYTLSGVQIQKVVLNSVDSYNVNVASLATGMYIIKISTNDSVSIQRFIKK